MAPFWVVDAINPILSLCCHAAIRSDEAVRGRAKLARFQLVSTYDLLAVSSQLSKKREILTSHPEARVDDNTGLISVHIPLDTSVGA